MTTTAEQIEAVAAELGLTMTAKFVPWSLSRNAGEGLPSLNWKVTLYRAATAPGRSPLVVLTTDYGAGCGHCPSYKLSVKDAGGRNSLMRDELIRKECETGKDNKTGKPILPKLADVLHSLASDADVIDCGTFEEWAGDLGYDTDSRKAEGIYRACLKIALKLRNALGEDGLRELREAVQDY